MQRRVGEIALRFGAGGAQRPEAGGPFLGVGQQRGLADAGLALEDHPAAAAVRSIPEQLVKHSGLVVPAQDPPGTVSTGRHRNRRFHRCGDSHGSPTVRHRTTAHTRDGTIVTRGAWRGRTAIVVGAAIGVGAAVADALSQAGAGVVLAARPGPALTALAAGIVSAGGQAVAAPVDVTDPASVRRLVEQTLGAFGRLDLAVNQVRPHELSAAMRYQVPAMRRAGGGQIVNLAPDAGLQSAVAELTRAAALEHAGSGVRIDFVAAASYDSAERLAEAVMWLCSGGSPLPPGGTGHLPHG
ncbi:SDR family NAD(P)-dependent oxidoreductase [Nonomuraea phyllanthi]|nr:SDR family NAD(P)-dependent oxidoreductase [Nonomuraea phyllanthi]